METLGDPHKEYANWIASEAESETPPGSGDNPEQPQVTEADNQEESAREEAKTKNHEDLYKNLSNEEKSNFPALQQQAVGIIDKAIRGESQIDDMSNEEQVVLNKVIETFQKAKGQDPDSQPTLQFTNQIDQVVYTNLVNRLAFGLAKEKGQLDAQSPEDTRIKESQPLSENEIVNIQNEAYATYKAEQGDVNRDLMLHNIDWKIGQQFDAHGISKGTVTEQLKQLIAILDNGIDTSRDFYTAPLEVDPDDKSGWGAGLGTAGGTAYKDSSFVLIGAPGEKITDSGIKNVVVNDLYYGSIDKLSSAYPDIRFIRADQVDSVLKEIIGNK